MREKQVGFPIIDMKGTGQWLRFLCKREKITVNELQERLQIASNQAIYAWFNGKTLPSLDNLYGLSRVLCMQMDDLLVLEGMVHPYLKKMEKGERRIVAYMYKTARCTS